MKILVLDEADQLLEDSFARDLRRLTKVKGWPKVFYSKNILYILFVFRMRTAKLCFLVPLFHLKFKCGRVSGSKRKM